MEENTILEKETFEKVKMPSKTTLFFKRLFDIISSSIAIILLLPFFIMFTPVVAIAMHGNPFFVQERPGKDEKMFKLIKYRTMNNKKDKDGNLLPDADRLNKFGELMRKLSFDEWPELFNILKGDMSVVGPRPQLIRDMWFMNKEVKQRHNVRPGLTGLAQISGRNDIDWEEKFRLDLHYIEKMNFFFDLKIIFGTILKVLKKDGISQVGEATADDYGVYLVKQQRITQEDWEKVVNNNNAKI